MMSDPVHAESPVIVARDGAVATITVNRPAVRNALNDATLGAIDAAVAALEADPAVRVILLTGAGDKAFVAGADINELSRADAITGRTLAQRGQAVFDRIAAAGKPIIAVINGFCLGGGCELALACDVRVAAPGIKLGLPEATIGMGANFGSVVLPKRIPMGIAMEMLLTGEYVTSEDVERWGLINRITDDVLPVALELAERIAANAPISVRRMKETAVKGLELPMWQALRLDVGPNPYLSEDRKEGIAAYLEKRPPRWSGR
jgi:enoyl-CoA hydratase/carnithine racemase